MKSGAFVHFGIPFAECEVEAALDHKRIPFLSFKSRGNPIVMLDLGLANLLREELCSSGDTVNADEIDRLIKEARRLR